ncbi:hypothetical protein PR202_gb19330 [Eleusine coracana subsp. coracana]|uniref:Uncharacterized protein n=1 Tax=Eleusine coracana subsp. coracana TaxID=191504 RepID=A0AAV5F7Z1_ELECO|nr:hypothetical protein PR202_gb19330 [Eleusine coracana subsp. coracana]
MPPPVVGPPPPPPLPPASLSPTSISPAARRRPPARSLSLSSLWFLCPSARFVRGAEGLLPCKPTRRRDLHPPSSTMRATALLPSAPSSTTRAAALLPFTPRCLLFPLPPPADLEQEDAAPAAGLE